MQDKGELKTQTKIPFYLESVSKDMDKMAYKVKFVNAHDAKKDVTFAISFEFSEYSGMMPGALAWNELKKATPGAILIDKQEMPEAVAAVWEWPQWESPFYKKQNEIMIKELAKEHPDETSYSFPMYTEKKFEKGVSTGDWDWKKFGATSKKGVCKDPPVKPGDDWWIML